MRHSRIHPAILFATTGDANRKAIKALGVAREKAQTLDVSLRELCSTTIGFGVIVRIKTDSCSYQIDTFEWKLSVSHDLCLPISVSYHGAVSGVAKIISQKKQIIALIYDILPQPIAEALEPQICMVEEVLTLFGVPFFTFEMGWQKNRK